MAFSPATAGGKLGTAVWWRPAGGSKVKVIDYDCSRHRITAVAFRWDGECFTFVAAHAPTRAAEPAEHDEFMKGMDAV
eukprot:10616283-Lingulodinium_polyedra.AAC.1